MSTEAANFKLKYALARRRRLDKKIKNTNIIEIVRIVGKGKAFIITSRVRGNKGLVLLFIDNTTAKKVLRMRVRAFKKPLRPSVKAEQIYIVV